MIEIFHVSDLHFGQIVPDPDYERKAKWLLKQIEDRFSIDIEPNTIRYLLVTGDVTQGGSKAQYQRAKGALSFFKDKVWLTPGNHDWSVVLGNIYRPYCARRFDKFAQEVGFKHAFFGKKPWSQTFPEPPASAELLVIGLNSCKRLGFWNLSRGKIGRKNLQWLSVELAKPEYEKLPKIVFLHHDPIDSPISIAMALDDHEEFVKIVEGRALVVAFGHQYGRLPHPAELPPVTKLQIIKQGTSIGSQAKGLVGGKSNTHYLDADNSVKEHSCYKITVDQQKVDLTVEVFAPPLDTAEAETGRA